MTNTLKIATDLYSKPPLNALGGSRLSYRKVSLATADLITTQIYAMNVLPAGHRLVDAFVETNQLETASSAFAFTIGILNTYYGDPAATTAVPAAYSSGGATNVATSPILVTGQNLITAATIGQTGGRIRLGISATSYLLTSSIDVGVDKNKDRIVAMQVTSLATTPTAGSFAIGLLLDRDQE